MRKYLGTVLTLILVLGGAIAAPAAQRPDMIQILKNIDAQSTFPASDFSAVMTIISEDPEKGLEKSVVRFFRRDREDKFLLLFQEPEVMRGQGYLLIDDNLWFYDPESRKFSHTSLKENLRGTDAKNSDFHASSLAEDYAVNSYSEGKLGNIDVYIIDLQAKNDEVTYPYLKLWVSKNPNLVLKAEEYSLSKRLLRTTLFPGYTKVGNNYVASTMIFTDELVPGKKTQITVKEISLAKLPDTVFTKSYLERVNR
jgi:outer membrane lipoprotein-sorting protein